MLGRIPVTFVYLCNIFYGMAVLVNLLGCLWLFTARCEGYENSWLTEVGEALQTAAFFVHTWTRHDAAAACMA